MEASVMIVCDESSAGMAVVLVTTTSPEDARHVLLAIIVAMSQVHVLLDHQI